MWSLVVVLRGGNNQPKVAPACNRDSVLGFQTGRQGANVLIVCLMTGLSRLVYLPYQTLLSLQQLLTFISSVYARSFHISPLFSTILRMVNFWSTDSEL